MSYNLTSGQLEEIRGKKPSHTLFLGVFEPPVVFQAQIDDALAEKGMIGIAVDNIQQGSMTGVAYGQTLYLSTGLAGDFIGRVRVRSGSVADDIIYVATDDSMDYRDNYWVTVRNHHEFWPKHPLAIQEDDINTQQANNPIFKDYDIPYTDDNTVFSPVVTMGPDVIKFNTPTGVTIYFSASGSYTVDGNALVTYAWGFPSGTPDVDSTETPGYVYWPSGTDGNYVVSLSITNAAGKTWTGYRNVSIASRPESNGPNKTIMDWSLVNITGDITSGWEAKFSVKDRADNFKDGYMVYIFAETKQNGTEYNWPVGPTDREHILLIGYVDESQTTYNYQTSETVITINGLRRVMDTREMSGITYFWEETQTRWESMSDTRLKYIRDLYLRWHTTALDIVDFPPLTHARGDYPQARLDLQRGTITSQLDIICSRNILAPTVSDRYNTLITQVDPNFTPTGTRSASLYEFLRQDYIGDIQISENPTKRVAILQASGVYSFPNAPSGVAYFSQAPGYYPAYDGGQENITGLNIADQDELNAIAGLLFGSRNPRTESITLRMAQEFRNIDIWPLDYFSFSIDINQTERGIIWNSQRIYPKKITYQFQDNELLQTVVFAPETYGNPGDTILINTDLSRFRPRKPRIPRRTRRMTPRPGSGRGPSTRTVAFVLTGDS